METLLLGKYQLFETIGAGNFGEVRRAKNCETQQIIAIKFVHFANEQTSALYTESEVLSQLQGGGGIPKLYAYGKQEGFEYMVTELLGSNLLDLFRDCKRKFSLETVAAVATQVLERVEFVHSRGFLHRDIKPQNILIGTEDKTAMFYLTDFGLAKRYMNEFYIHIPYKTDTPFAGTMFYAANNTHLGIQQSRRDDVECLLYVLIYLSKGSLPWNSSRLSCKSAHESIKLTITPAQLCSGLPDCFYKALTYVRALQFEEKPDYGYLRSLFRTALMKTGLCVLFDWQLLNIRKRKNRSKTEVKNSLSNSPKRSLRKQGTVDYCHEKSSVVDGHSIRRKMIGLKPTQPDPKDESVDETPTIEDRKLPCFKRRSLP